MKMSKALKAFLEQAKDDGSFWIERAKIDFARSLEAQRRRAGLSYAELANRLGTSAAYVSKVFRGDSNVTIESMVKLADAAGGRVDIQVIDKDAAVEPWASVVVAKATAPTASSVTPIDMGMNDERFGIAA